MQPADPTSGAEPAAPSPDWVADWWMPPGDAAADVDLDLLEAMLAPEPAPLVRVEVAGRPLAREAIAG